MLDYGTQVVAGVTPGRGGGTVEGVPVYDTVAQAVKAHSIDCSIVYVPPRFAADAAQEAIAGGIRKLVISTERIPRHDMIHLLHDAAEAGADIVGPNTVGVLNPAGRVKLGPIGGDSPNTVYHPGNIAVISRSGGMTSETAWVVRQAGFGISEAISIGGDALIGLTPHDLLIRFEHDPNTACVVMFSEPATSHEQAVAELIRQGDFTKPLIAYIAGRFTEQMPSQGAFGHAGAFLGSESRKPGEKEADLRDAGAYVAHEHQEIKRLLMEIGDGF